VFVRVCLTLVHTYKYTHTHTHTHTQNTHTSHFTSFVGWLWPTLFTPCDALDTHTHIQIHTYTHTHHTHTHTHHTHTYTHTHRILCRLAVAYPLHTLQCVCCSSSFRTAWPWSFLLPPTSNLKNSQSQSMQVRVCTCVVLLTMYKLMVNNQFYFPVAFLIEDQPRSEERLRWSSKIGVFITCFCGCVMESKRKISSMLEQWLNSPWQVAESKNIS